MATYSLSFATPSSSITRHHHHQHRHILSPTAFDVNLIRTIPALQAYRRSNSISPQESDESVNDGRRWSNFGFDGYYDDEGDDEDDDEDEEEDRSLDLLIRFVENVFRKVSKRARKAVRSVLPLAISTKLVGFAVNGLLILSFLWILKAFLEFDNFRLFPTFFTNLHYVKGSTSPYILPVMCTLGTVVFVSILLIRGVWSGILYLQDGRARHMNGIDDDQPEWSRTQPAT